MDVLSKLIVEIMSQYTHISNHHVVTLNLYNALCQFYLSKAGKKISIKSPVTFCD